MYVTAHATFLVAVRGFVQENLDKSQALFGILATEKFGIDRKINAIAAILKIDRVVIPRELNAHLGTHAAATERVVRDHVVMALGKNWRRWTEAADLVRIRRRQLRSGDFLDYPLAKRLRRHRDGWYNMVNIQFSPKTQWIWEQLQIAKKDLRELVG